MTSDNPPPEGTGSPTDMSRSAIRDPWSHLRLWTVAAAFLSLDLWSKAWAFATLGATDVRYPLPGILSFRRSVNPGALFGMGKGLVPLFIVASFIALGFVLFLFAASSPKRRSLHLALSCVIAGSLGNLYDRSFIRADKVVFPDGTELIGKVLEHDASPDHLRIGAAIDGDKPRFFRSEGASISQVGIVRDFLKIEPKIAGRDVWPWVFNVADSLLVAGVTILMLNFWFERRAVNRAEHVDSLDAPPV